MSDAVDRQLDGEPAGADDLDLRGRCPSRCRRRCRRSATSRSAASPRSCRSRLSDPVASVPPVPLLLSCSPTVRSTEATVPSNVATSDAPASASFAFVSAVVRRLEAGLVRGELRVGGPRVLVVGELRLGDGDVGLRARHVTARARPESIVARTWPAFTVSPAFTLTAVTVPDELKLRSSVSRGGDGAVGRDGLAHRALGDLDELADGRRRGARVVVGAERDPPARDDHEDDRNGHDDDRLAQASEHRATLEATAKSRL